MRINANRHNNDDAWMSRKSRENCLILMLVPIRLHWPSHLEKFHLLRRRIFIKQFIGVNTT